MRTNKVRARATAGQISQGCLFNFRSLQLVELIGLLGFDYVLIGEHGAFSMPDVEEMCIVADRMGMAVMARVPDLDESTIMQFLDRGVLCIEAGHVNGRADVEALIRACKFAPEGQRSFAGHRIMDYGLPQDASGVMAQANREVMIIAHIESVEALDDLAGILAVPGLDGVSIGSFDLSQSLGHAGQVKHPAVVETVRRAADQIRASGKIYAPDVIRYTRIVDLVTRAGQDYLRVSRQG